MGDFFDCEIQARLRDVNAGGHVDNVEAIRVIDEARGLFLQFARVSSGASTRAGHLGEVPDGVTELVGAQRVDYHAEMRFAAYRPFLVRVWISHVGRSSFAVSSEMRMAADHEPALVAETSLVLWDGGAHAPWPISDQVRTDLEHYRGEPVTLRERPRQ